MSAPTITNMGFGDVLRVDEPEGERIEVGHDYFTLCKAADGTLTLWTPQFLEHGWETVITELPITAENWPMIRDAIEFVLAGVDDGAPF